MTGRPVQRGRPRPAGRLRRRRAGRHPGARHGARLVADDPSGGGARRVGSRGLTAVSAQLSALGEPHRADAGRSSTVRRVAAAGRPAPRRGPRPVATRRQSRWPSGAGRGGRWPATLGRPAVAGAAGGAGRDWSRRGGRWPLPRSPSSRSRSAPASCDGVQRRHAISAAGRPAGAPETPRRPPAAPQGPRRSGADSPARSPTTSLGRRRTRSRPVNRHPGKSARWRGQPASLGDRRRRRWPASPTGRAGWTAWTRSRRHGAGPITVDRSTTRGSRASRRWSSASPPPTGTWAWASGPACGTPGAGAATRDSVRVG